jgi:hypothetical protein
MDKATLTRAVNLIFGAALFAPLAGCSGVLGIESDRTLEDDNQVTLAEQWRCLEDAAPAGSDASMVKQTLHFYDVTIPKMGKSVPGLSVRACPRIDFDCALPVSETVVSDAEGLAVVSVPSGFNGYYEAFGASSYQPYIIAEEEIHADSYADIPVASLAVAAAYAGAAGAKLEEGMGELLMTVRDCGGVPAAGTSFDVNARGASVEEDELIYLVNSLPTPGATETDVSGAAVIFNLAPGAVNATALLSDGGVEIASRSALIRGGWETQMRFYPAQLARSE